MPNSHNCHVFQDHDGLESLGGQESKSVEASRILSNRLLHFLKRNIWSSACDMLCMPAKLDHDLVAWHVEVSLEARISESSFA